FWLSWLLFFLSTFFYAQQGMQGVGSLSWIVVILIKSFMLLLCHAFIVYSIIYFLLPRFLLKHQYMSIVAGLLVTSTITFAWAYFCYSLLFHLFYHSFHFFCSISTFF